MPIRRLKDNKTRGGKCAIVAGSKGKWGAAVMCAQGAARVGAGYVFVFDGFKDFPTTRHPDFLLIEKMNDFSNMQSIAIGPGLNDSKFIKKLINKLIKKNHKAVVLDAEAINIIAKSKKLQNLPPTWIITPHEGELSRVLKVSSQKIRSDRKKYVRVAQKKLGCLVLLKGFRTLVAVPGQVWEVQAGNPALAKAGTGDVLTGMIAGFLSQGLKPLKAACLGAFVHGFIADQWIGSKRDQLSLMASDLVTQIPQGLYKMRQ